MSVRVLSRAVLTLPTPPPLADIASGTAQQASHVMNAAPFLLQLIDQGSAVSTHMNTSYPSIRTFTSCARAVTDS